MDCENLTAAAASNAKMLRKSASVGVALNKTANNGTKFDLDDYANPFKALVGLVKSGGGNKNDSTAEDEDSDEDYDYASGLNETDYWGDDEEEENKNDEDLDDYWDDEVDDDEVKNETETRGFRHCRGNLPGYCYAHKDGESDCRQTYTDTAGCMDDSDRIFCASNVTCEQHNLFRYLR